MVDAARVLADKTRNGVLTPSLILAMRSAEPSTTKTLAKRKIGFHNESNMDLAMKTDLASNRWEDTPSAGPFLPLRDLPLEHVD
jgi:hypothetical protein